MSDIQFFAEVLFPALLDGTLVTLALIATAAPFGFLTGVLVAVGRTYGNPQVAYLCRSYVVFFKGCPLILLLLILYYGLPSLGIKFSPFVAAVIGFILCNGAYNSEYIRGSLSSVKEGQMIAAQALGMTRMQAIRAIVLPQALRRALPGILNEFIYLIKYSSLAYMVTVIELTGAGKIVAARYFDFFEVFAIVGLIYLIIVSVATVVVGVIEKKIAYPV